MSNFENTRLYERAAEAIDYWGDTLIAQVIEQDLERQDLDALYQHVCEAEARAAEQEFHSYDIIC